MTIEEIKEQRSELWDKYQELGEELKRREIAEHDYTGKYIHISEYGYMYVTWQKYEEKSYYGDSRMFFQGIMFRGSASPYRDDMYLNADAMEEWYIPIGTFQRYIRDNDIKEITKEEFINKFNEIYVSFTNKFYEVLENSEKYLDN